MRRQGQQRAVVLALCGAGKATKMARRGEEMADGRDTGGDADVRRHEAGLEFGVCSCDVSDWRRECSRQGYVIRRGRVLVAGRPGELEGAGTRLREG